MENKISTRLPVGGRYFIGGGTYMPVKKKEDVVPPADMAKDVPLMDMPAEAPAEKPADQLGALADRIPKGLDIGMVIYVRFAKGADVQAERVKAITIRETNVGIMMQSGREINAAEIGRMMFLKEKDVK